VVKTGFVFVPKRKLLMILIMQGAIASILMGPKTGDSAPIIRAAQL